MTIFRLAIILRALTPSAKRIFEILHWMDNEWQKVEPSVEYLMKVSTYSRATVKRAISTLKMLELLTCHKRAYRTNVYCIDPEVSKMNLQKVELMSKKQLLASENMPNPQKNLPPNEPVNEPVNEPIYKSTKKEEENISTRENSTHIKNAKEIRPYDFLNRFCLSLSEKRTLTMKFAESKLIGAIERWNWYTGQGNPVRSDFGFLLSQAKCF